MTFLLLRGVFPLVNEPSSQVFNVLVAWDVQSVQEIIDLQHNTILFQSISRININI